MNTSKILDLFKLAADRATSKSDVRTFSLGAVGIRADGACVSSCNSPSTARNRKAHAEYKALKKCDFGATLFVARVKSDGSYGMSRPCPNCSKVIITKGVKKVYYTINEKQYGVWTPSTDSDKVYNFK